jgi:transcriptional regulator with XRE-family HTH domain
MNNLDYNVGRTVSPNGMIMNQEAYFEAGQFLRRRRELLDMSQDDVAQALKREGVEISVSTYQRIEIGQTTRHYGDSAFMNALANVLRCDVEDILAATGHIRPKELRFDTRTQRFMELASKLDPDSLDAAEEILKVLVAEQKKRERR